MLNPSRLYSFLDSKNGVALHFFDGQKLIHDLALIHALPAPAFAFFRDAVLGFMPMLAFLKPGESLGIYVDSEVPYFRLKVETNHAGHTRTLLLPEDFSDFPKTLTGTVRVTKQFPGGKTPYTSVVDFKDSPPHDLTNQVIRISYQASAETVVSQVADQSAIVVKLPRPDVDRHLPDPTPDLESYLAQSSAFLEGIFRAHPDTVENVVDAFEKGPFAYLSSRQVGFFCPCSHEGMADNLRMLYASDLEQLFAGDPEVEAKCDYCKKKYRVTRQEVMRRRELN